ncbi:MAG: hypothetical protein PVF58_21275 [Candidatus Methanofastidiosia archaeon]
MNIPIKVPIIINTKKEMGVEGCGGVVSGGVVSGGGVFGEGSEDVGGGGVFIYK